jgi:hypothetical protein
MALLNLCAVIGMYCFALADGDGSRSDKTAAVILFVYNLFLAVAGVHL